MHRIIFLSGLTLLACGPSATLPVDAASTDGGTSSDAGHDPSIVTTTGGPVRGVDQGAIRVFRGIPYAAPPIGDLRFRPPRAPAPFDGVFDATEFGAECPQRETTGLLGPADGDVIGDEDCLTLNVWAPSAPASPRPVMVWIHGGAFKQGSGSRATYDGTNLVTAGDVLLVTLNYRLGILGLLATEQLATESGEDSAGNYAFRDQITALQWVRDNIAAFGGDPDNVTIFGESAGGVSVCGMIGSPLADGLFVRAIIESGSGCYTMAPMRSETQRSAMDQGVDLVAAAGCLSDGDELACMRSRSAEALVTAGLEGSGGVLGLPDFSPTIDGVVLPQASFDRFASGEHDVPLMIGSNADEAMIFTIATSVPTAAQFETLVRAALGEPLAAEVLPLYPVADYSTPKAAFNQLVGDIAFVCPALAMAEAAAGGEHPSYTYHLTHALGGSYAAFGAFHSLDVLFVFGNFPADYTLSASDRALVSTMQGSWTSFARDGAPVTTPSWSPLDPNAPEILFLDEPPSIETELVGGRCAALQDLGVIRDAR